MLVVTNRNIQEDHFPNGVGDEKAFGEGCNEKGPNELRLAHAQRKNGAWRVKLVEEPKLLTPENLPSRVEFLRLRKRCRDSGRHCLFFVHGYNKTFCETLEQGWLLQQRYRVEVVVFSWPANPGGFPVDEYRHARRIAQASFGALDALLEKFGNYLREDAFDKGELLGCAATVNLMTYSLGSYLFQNYVLSNEYADETRMFTNVVLCQADVDSAGHPAWVERVVAGQRICVTINENDKILGFSEAVNYARLGKTVANLAARNAQYFDFTGGAKVGNTHQLWGEVNTATAKKFFKILFEGGRPEGAGGFDYDARVNAWRIRG